MKISTSIVIPNWNGEHLLKKCLESVYSLNSVDYEVIIVDNNSHDGSIKLIENNFPNTQVIKLNSNTGFSFAVNTGIQASKGDFIALLNNDTEVDKNWLSELQKSFNIDTSIGIVTSKLINYFDRNKIDAAGDEMNIVGQARSRGHGDSIDAWNFGDFVFSATGGASLYKKDVFSKIGLFDEIYYMYFEDADLCYRAQKNGIKIYYQPKAIVYHMHRASSNKRGDFLEYLLYRNFAIFYIVNTPKELFNKRYSLVKFLLVFIHTAYYLTKKGKFTAVLKVWIWFATNTNKIISVRKHRKSELKVSLDYVDSLRLNKVIKIAGKSF